VADVLFGLKPFTGRLPETWAKAESQLPINVGDKTYDPLYPFGWGLRTDSPHARVQALRTELAGEQGTATAVRALDTILKSSNWNRDGSVRDATTMMRLLAAAASAMNGSKFTFTQQDELVSVARDLAQSAVVAGGSAAMSATASLTADAEHDVLSGQPANAVSELAQARTAAAGGGGHGRAPRLS
jgi:beta-glucosidase